MYRVKLQPISNFTRLFFNIFQNLTYVECQTAQYGSFLWNSWTGNNKRPSNNKRLKLDVALADSQIIARSEPAVLAGPQNCRLHSIHWNSAHPKPKDGRCNHGNEQRTRHQFPCSKPANANQATRQHLPNLNREMISSHIVTPTPIDLPIVKTAFILSFRGHVPQKLRSGRIFGATSVQA